jgi:tetratricopeptide (TPR) repeat protein
MEDGTFHTEFGATFQSGAAFAGGNQVGTWDDYFSYGIGYAYDVNRFADMSIEVAGHTATVQGNNIDFEDDLDLIFGSNIGLSPDIKLKPSVGFALMEGSPDYSVGLAYEIGFGRENFPRDPEDREPPREERFSTRDPVGTAPADEEDETMDENGEMTSNENQPSDKVNELMDKGYAASQAGNLDRAIELYERAEKMSPDNTLAQSNLGSLHYRKGNYRTAIDHYRNALKSDPQDTFSMLYLGASHYQLGNLQAAREYFQRVTELEPENQRAQNWLDRLNQEQ